MKVFAVSKGIPEGTIPEEDQKKFKKANTLFGGCVLSDLIDHL
jgi:hypothetical protein